MTATWTSGDLAIRVEVAPDAILFSADHGQTWKGLPCSEARGLARGLCSAADRVEDALTEREHAA